MVRVYSVLHQQGSQRSSFRSGSDQSAQPISGRVTFMTFDLEASMFVVQVPFLPPLVRPISFFPLFVFPYFPPGAGLLDI